MSNVDYQTFMTGGLIVLVCAVVMVAWAIWRVVERGRDMEERSLEGVGLELGMNLQRLALQLSAAARGNLVSPNDVIPFAFPQLDALLATPSEAPRASLTAIRSIYDELVSRQHDVREALARRQAPDEEVWLASDALVTGLAWLYLWREHDGAQPVDARSTRSWHVRDWMKSTVFDADLIPGLHLRDAVVEKLRMMGMTLTPKPLDHTAHEYFSKRYDRKADPNAPFWNRNWNVNLIPAGVFGGGKTAASAAQAETASEPVIEPVVEPVVEPAPVSAPEPALPQLSVSQTDAAPASEEAPALAAKRPEAESAPDDDLAERKPEFS